MGESKSPDDKNEHGNVYYDKDEKSSVSQMTSTKENLNRKKVFS